MTPYRNGQISHWMTAARTAADLGGEAHRTTADLPGQEQDLVVVGGGLTGLWAAYHAIAERPEARITVVEAMEVGYGASGRNGG